jgi:hypothetical protein
MPVDLGALWGAGGVLAGLQITAFTLRITREITVGREGDITWLPLADVLNLLSLLVTMLGVFVAPIVDLGGAAFPMKAFGASVILLAGYPFALAGHYDMYNFRTTRTMAYCPRQERVVLVVVAAVLVGYVGLAVIR